MDDKKRIDQLDKKVDNVEKKIEERDAIFAHKIDIIASKVKWTNDMMLKMLNSMKASKENSISFAENVVLWISIPALMIFFALIFISMNNDFVKFIERSSSIITAATILCGGIYASFMMNQFSQRVSKVMCVVYSALFACYAAYVSFDFGSFHPYVAAIGFNVVTMGQVLSIVMIVSYIQKMKYKKEQSADEEYIQDAK